MKLPKHYIAVALTCFLVIAEALKSSKNTEVSLAFEKARIVPDVIKEAPTNKIKVWWDTASVELGNKICPLRTILAPRLEFDTVPGKNYTLMFIDADQPSRAAAVYRSYLLRMDVNIPASNLEGGYKVAPFIPPVPAPGTGEHRVVIVVFEQFSLIDIYNENVTDYGVSRIRFSIPKASATLGLGPLIAGNFYYTQAPNFNEKPECSICKNEL